MNTNKIINSIVTPLVARILIASVMASAAFGIWALLRGDFDAVSGRTLLTTLTVSAASLLIMANGVAASRGRLSKMPLATLPLVSGTLAIVTAPVLVTSYWLDFDPEGLWKFGLSMEFAAVFTAYAALASASESPRRYRIVQYAVYPVAAALATVLIVIIWKEWLNPPAWRTIGVLAITLVALTVATPLLRRLESQQAGATGSSDPYSLSHCPNCGKRVDTVSDEASCTNCGAQFRVEFKV